MKEISLVTADSGKSSRDKRLNKFYIFIYIDIIIFLIAIVLLLKYPGFLTLVFFLVTLIPIVVIIVYYSLMRKKQSSHD